MAGESPVQKLECPNCGAPLKVTAVGQSLSVVCSACYNIADISNPGVAKFYEAQKKMKYDPLIPIGRRGKMMGETYEAIGYMVRTDGSGMYEWEEYLLFNPYKGYRWLVQFGGHWNYVIPMKSNPKETLGGDANHLGRHYRKFLSGTAKVKFVLGEFYWRVKKGDEVRVADFIHPPEILSKEIDNNEEIWSLGTYIEPKLVSEGFKLEKPLPPKIGIAPNQPSNWSDTYKEIRNTTWIAAGALFLIQIVSAMFLSNEVVFNQKFGEYSSSQGYPNYALGQPIVTPPFEFKGKRQNLSLSLQAPVNNQWFELQGDLVNEETGESFAFVHGVEFWSGYDDGYWSEGSNQSDFIFSYVPGGKYHLVLEPSNSTNAVMPFTLEVRRGVTLFKNFFVCLFYLMIFPLFAFWRHHRFEYKRWAESDISPYEWINTTGEVVGNAMTED